LVSPLSFLDARAAVLRELRAHRVTPPTEEATLAASGGRILAENIPADRDYPPFNRSVRDGFAVRAGDVPGRLRVIGEVRAGERFAGALRKGEALEIMTGAPVPEGADAVVMVEHCVRHDDGTVETDRIAASGANIAPAACEARAGQVVLKPGTRIDYTAVAWLATIGRSAVAVYVRPRVAILATGDEIVGVAEAPAPHQIRNSNTYSLAAQVRRAGGDPVILPVARDNKDSTRQLIQRGLDSDLLLLSGGVSAGKYDLVEPVFEELGAEFYFDRVLIQPGQPLVFGRARQKFFFGLPGNPASTMVTFELFARAALELLAGASDAPLPLTLARLSRPFSHKAGLTRFLPASVSCAEVTPVDWKGSGDVPALCRANAFLVADAAQPEYAAGDPIPVLLK
jgi:molybdopterin molybdotransferase